MPPIEEITPAEARRRMIHEALAPAESTADWRRTLDSLSASLGTVKEDFAHSALDGLTVIEAPDEAVEAETAALLLRQVMQHPTETAALVTPDATLARRVSGVLQRWGLDVPPSSGSPLGQTTAGSLIGLCARWVLDPAEPVILTAVLKHFSAKRNLLSSIEISPSRLCALALSGASSTALPACVSAL